MVARLVGPALLAMLAVAALLVAPAAGQARGEGADALGRARALRVAGDIEQAVSVLDGALATDPGDVELQALLGLCLLDLRQVDRARVLAEERAGYDGSCFQLHVFLGRLAMAEGREDDAVEAFRAALERKGDCIEALVHLITIDIRVERYGRALKHALALKEAQPELGARYAARVLRCQGEQFARSGPEGLGHAIEKYSEAHELLPADEELTGILLDALVLAVRLDEARAVAARAYPGPEQAADRLYWEGQCAAAAQDVAAATSAYQAALAADAGHGPSALGLGRLCLTEGDAAGARAWLERGRTSLPDSPRLMVMLGEAMLELGELGAAEDYLRSALERDPDNTKALYQLGRLLVRIGQREEGQELLARLAELQKPPPLLSEAPERSRRER